MDLTIESKDYVFNVDGVPLSLIEIFMSNELKTSVREGTFYLTRKEINALIEYIENNQTGTKYEQIVIDNFKAMNMLLQKKRIGKIYVLVIRVGDIL